MINKISPLQLLLIRRIYIYLLILKYFHHFKNTGITAGVINSGDNILTSGETQSITLRLTSSTNAPDTSYATLNVKTAEGINTRLDASVSLVSSIPIITTAPSYIDTGMVRGNQKIATFTLTNAGEETLRNARIEGPSTSWMSLTVGTVNYFV